MLYLYTIFATCCLLLLGAGIVEQRRHFAHLHRIPQRVLVNGIRGKSSITRLCAGALRGGRLVVVAKTTGTAARFIFPDASEEPIYRKFGIANVVEQIGIVRRAASFHPDVLVIECMAVTPSLQEINQSKLIQSTIGVISNVREDHVAEMGPTLDDIARSLSRSMPVGGVCVTAERERLPVLRREAERRRCQLVVVDPESVSDDEMRRFSWITFKENVAIALAVSQLLGIDRRSALAGMWATPPDPGALRVDEYRVNGKVVHFANVFAANDPESTLQNVQQLERQGMIHRPFHMIINCRPDRVERNGQMGALVPRVAPERVILIGEPTRSARAKIPAEWQDQVTDLGGPVHPRDILKRIIRDVNGYATLVAVGNIHGQGELLLERLDRLDRPVPAIVGNPPGQRVSEAERYDVYGPWNRQ